MDRKRIEALLDELGLGLGGHFEPEFRAVERFAAEVRVAALDEAIEQCWHTEAGDMDPGWIAAAQCCRELIELRRTPAPAKEEP